MGERPHNGQAPEEAPPEEPRPDDDSVDEVVAASFPASDPPSWWAGTSD